MEKYKITYNFDAIYFRYYNPCEIYPGFLVYDIHGNILRLDWVTDNLSGHRKNKPAAFEFNKGYITGCAYFVNNKKYNDIGPAVIYYTEDGEIKEIQYFLNDKEYSYEDFIKTSEYQTYLKKQAINIFD